MRIIPGENREVNLASRCFWFKEPKPVPNIYESLKAK